jgi:hypothetical protein
MTEAPANQRWFLRKHEDGSVFGPLRFEQVQRWASEAQIAPHDKLSTDQKNWLKAPMYPELRMDWLVEVTSESYYGPTTLGAVREFLALGEISEETFVINSRDGARLQVASLPETVTAELQPTLPLESKEKRPSTSRISLDLRARIATLEQSLREERRALQEAETRYHELEARYQELLGELAE